MAAREFPFARLTKPWNAGLTASSPFSAELPRTQNGTT
jgi:hypothetical protein